jgi:hypothetical protein
VIPKPHWDHGKLLSSWASVSSAVKWNEDNSLLPHLARPQSLLERTWGSGTLSYSERDTEPRRFNAQLGLGTSGLGHLVSLRFTDHLS